MSYCLNPIYPTPENPSHSDVCQTCGFALRLKNRYRAIRAIGRGGFGRTLLAVDEPQPLKTCCVIKQFLPQPENLTHTEKASNLFKEEVLRLRDVGKHPKIPDLLGYCSQQGYQYLIQEFIDGRDLAKELTEDGAFSELKIRQLLEELLPVVQFIHDRHIIHRDIKPANIIRRRTDRSLFLVDLGAAKQTTGTALAQTGTVIGSAEYVAPEQSHGKAVFASDLYSLGATCIHLLTGISPFDLYNSHEGIWVWQDYLPQPVSRSLASVLNKMLQNATSKRYDCATQILADIRSFQGETTVQPPRDSINTASRDSATFDLNVVNEFDDTEPREVLTPERITAQLSRIPGGAIVPSKAPKKLIQPNASPSDDELIFRNIVNTVATGLSFCTTATICIVGTMMISMLFFDVMSRDFNTSSSQYQSQLAVEKIYPPTIVSTKAAVEFTGASEGQEALTVIRTYYGK